MLHQTFIPLIDGSNFYCDFRKISAEAQNNIVDPNVISKVESSGQYILQMSDSIKTDSLDLASMRDEMGATNQDLCTSFIDEIPLLVTLTNRKIPITIFRSPSPKKQKVIVFLHGGGFIGGSTKVLKNQCRFLAEQSDAAVISIDYRLAPENPYPAGLNDCKEIILWILKNAKKLKLSPDRITISGESAGGNFALAISLSKIGKYVALTIPIYGAIDLTLPSENNYWNYDKYPVIPEHRKYAITRLNRFANMNNIIRQLYCLNPNDIKNPEISPLYAKDFSHLQKVILIEAEYDFFRLSNDLMAQKLMNSNIDCKVIRYQGMDHGFFDRLGYCPQTTDCRLEIAKQVKAL